MRQKKYHFKTGVMQNYVKIYMQHFGYGEQDFIPCEACGARAVEIHHIYGRGKGKDVITNLMALCRKHHNWAHSSISKSDMQYIHNSFMQGRRGVFLN